MKNVSILGSLRNLGNLVYRENKKSLVFTCSLLVLAGASLYKNLSYNNSRDDLRSQVRVSADLRGDGDGAVTCDEWAGVYKSLGVGYDSHNPQHLSNSQLEAYLDSHSAD